MKQKWQEKFEFFPGMLKTLHSLRSTYIILMLSYTKYLLDILIKIIPVQK